MSGGVGLLCQWALIGGARRASVPPAAAVSSGRRGGGGGGGEEQGGEATAAGHCHRLCRGRSEGAHGGGASCPLQGVGAVMCSVPVTAARFESV